MRTRASERPGALHAGNTGGAEHECSCSCSCGRKRADATCTHNAAQADARGGVSDGRTASCGDRRCRGRSRRRRIKHMHEAPGSCWAHPGRAGAAFGRRRSLRWAHPVDVAQEGQRALRFPRQNRHFHALSRDPVQGALLGAHAPLGETAADAGRARAAR
eukprot:gene14347-biopygen14175